MKKSHAVEHKLDEQAKAASGIMDVLRSSDLHDDAELVKDTIEGQTDFLEAIDLAIEEIDNCEIIIDGCKEKEGQLSARRHRAEDRRNKLRAAIEQALMIAEIGEKIQRPTATVTLSKRKPALAIDDESKIPAQFFVLVPELDKDALRKAAEISSIEGCHMTNAAPTLTIRRK